jgi:release factor glutamine methyltransferase
MTARTALLQGTDLLAQAGIAEPRLTAEVLLCHALRQERVYLFSHPEYELSPLERLHYGRYLHERLRRKPTQYITRRQEFYGREFTVSPAVLIPRPDTELLIDLALRLDPAPSRILDIGTGSGILAATLALEFAVLTTATDLSFAALEVARANARHLGAPVRFVQTDFAAGLRGPFDLIVSNPPYVDPAQIPSLEPEVRDHEPHLALEGGLETYRRCLSEAERLLLPGGWLICEIGFDQADFLQLFSTGWTSPALHTDLAGRPRAILGRRAP